MGQNADHKVGPCSECPPGADEAVQIGPWQGWYSHGTFSTAPAIAGQPTPVPVWDANARHWGLIWNTDTLWFSMFYIPSSDDGGDMNKETLIKIAESLNFTHLIHFCLPATGCSDSIGVYSKIFSIPCM